MESLPDPRLVSQVPRLSVLDVAPVGPDVSANLALNWTTQVAAAAERLGYHRFWVAEHHAVPDIGSSAPAVLIAHLAAHTNRIRLGSGGVMLPNHAALVVAEQFSILHALYPDRIDLGVGRAKGADPVAAQALGHRPTNRDPGSFTDQLEELIGFLNGSFPSGHLFENVTVSPRADPPPVYLLGSSEESARAAAVRGLPFAFAHHLAPRLTESALATYRAAFLPSATLAAPYAIATVLVVCSGTQEDAERAAIAASAIRVRRNVASRQGRRPSTTELLSSRFTEEEARLIIDSFSGGGIFIGTAESVRAQITDLVRRTEADELMLCALEYDGPARIRTLTAVSEGW
ncbi:MAG: LLM class flavin-dependent oxidoreductase [Chloroflexota bacterium]|nr:LLM class flavin-dependent oxidoreductase [Chloroflexota bacterium]